MHSFIFACNSQCVTVWTCSYSCPFWGAVCCGLISNMAAFSFSNWAQATAVRVINKDGKPTLKPDSNNDEKLCKELNNYKAVMWLISGQGRLHNFRKYLLLFVLNFSSYYKWIPFMEHKLTAIRMRLCVLWLIEFERTWTWYWPVWRLFLIYFQSSCF